ncbi:MAG: alanyl-tRNA editing protein [Chloroflexi bacterium]|nr:alanyl-tRNA editing protein [Chloroflexota bacterium]
MVSRGILLRDGTKMNMLDSHRLYYSDPYLRVFTARVIASRTVEGKPAVALDRTAFYPTGGGQPNDTGTLNGVPIVDVVADDGLIWHVLASDVPSVDVPGTSESAWHVGDEVSDVPGASESAWHVGDEVSGVIDWPRRFDHMQQHTGQHVLSQAFIQTYDAETVAFHLGAAASTIDVSRSDLTPAMVAAVEVAANAVVDAARAVTAGFVAQNELASIPLRKPPKATAALRVVQVADFDWSACGGTHVANTAQIGLIKIIATERRGPELRVVFLCGGRARADYGRLQALASGLAARFTCAQDETPEAVERLANENRTLRKDLEDLEGQWVESRAAALWAEATPVGHGRLIAQTLDAPFERAKRVAQALRGRPGAIVLLGVAGERPQLVFTRADDVPLNVGDLLRTAVAAGGGRGGGRPDWAQGGAPTAEGLARALAVAAELAVMNRSAV